MNIEDMAEIAYTAARVVDPEQKIWARLSNAQKDVYIKIMQGYVDNPKAEPNTPHGTWFLKKKEDGWVKGSKKNVNKKTHPDMVPYDSLPFERRLRDKIFWGIARDVRQVESV